MEALLIKDNKSPAAVPVEELNSDWQNGHVVYTFTINEYCNKLDALSDAFRQELNLVELGVEESDVRIQTVMIMVINKQKSTRWNTQLCNIEGEW